MTTLAAAMGVRMRHEAPSGPRAQASVASLLRSSPSARPESLPAVPPPPGTAPVTRAAPHMLHGDAQHSHRAHGHVPANAEVLWSFHADGPIEGQVVASPDETTLYFSTLGGSLWALDRGGKPRFHIPLGARAYATPTVSPTGTVYVGSDGGVFYAIDPSGHVEWKLATAGDADTGSVLLDDGEVVFAAGSRVFGVARGGVIAFRFQAKGKVFTAPALTHAGPGHEPQIVVGSQDDHVYALTTKGELAWSTDLGHDVDGAAAIGDDGGIYVGTDGGQVVRLDDAGKVVWRVDVGGYVRGTLSIARNGDVLAGVYGPSPRLVRLSQGGDVRGACPVRGNGSRETGVYGGPLEDDDGALVFGGQDGKVHAIDPNGAERWAYDAHTDVDAPITLLGDGSLVVGDYDGNVVALGPKP